MSATIRELHAAIEELTISTVPLPEWYLYTKYYATGASIGSELNKVGLGWSLMVYYSYYHHMFYIPKDQADMEDYIQRGFYIIDANRIQV